MAGDVKNDSEPYDDINITPMVDLTFVLLLIFIIMTTAAIQGIKVNLPQASSQPSMAENEDQGHHDHSGRHYLPRYLSGDFQ